ncbi:MAG TPA: class I SAM-dependent methyltransferase [Methylovirgula sp.]|nr:class I SAM-dependent methyltransferase [Methylovirgula sp.]
MSLHGAYSSVIPGWYAGKEFSSDWTSVHFPVWIDVLQHFRERSCDVLEIGSWEGRSAVFFLEFLPLSRLTCIDTFGGGAENHASPTESCEIPQIERRFDTNLGAYGERVRKLKARSATALDSLVAGGAQYDVVYVDGSHMRDDAMIDSILAWRLLRPGGVMIWDDYAGGHDKRPAERVAPAIDAFLAWHFGEYVDVHRGYQIIIRRKAATSGWVVAYDPESGLAGAEIEQ